MFGKRYTEEFKIEAIKQVTERGHPATAVAARLGVSSHSLYQWARRFSAPPAEYRIMRAAGLHSQTGYGKRRFKRSGPASVVAPNPLQRQFDETEPNKVWVTDITYIRTHEGWLYLAAVLDLFSR